MNSSDGDIESEYSSAVEARAIIKKVSCIWEYWNLEKEIRFIDFLKMIESVIDRLDNVDERRSIGGFLQYEHNADALKIDQNKFSTLQLDIVKFACEFSMKSLNAPKNSLAAWRYVNQANHWLGIIMGLLSGVDFGQDIYSIRNKKQRSIKASDIANLRWSLDPAKKAKDFAKSCWDDWKANPGRYRNQPDFVNDILEKIEIKGDGKPVITFNTIIKKYIPEWQGKKV